MLLFSRTVALSSNTNGPDKLFAQVSTPARTIRPIRHHELPASAGDAARDGVEGDARRTLRFARRLAMIAS